MSPPIDKTNPADDDLELLLSVLPIFIKAADGLATEQTNIESRSPYLYMHALCMLVSKELDRVKQLVRSDAKCVVQLLDLLERVLSLSTTVISGLHGPYPKLATLRSQWNGREKIRSSQEENTETGALSLKFEHGRQTSDVLHQLQTVYDFCRRQYPEEAPICTEERTSPIFKRDAPAWTVWKAAQSTYQLLTSLKDCACDPGHSKDARLFIATHRGMGSQEDNCNLELFLSLGLPWQEVQIGVLENKPAVKVLINDKPATQPFKRNKQIRNLCKLITQFRKKPNQFRKKQLRFYRLRFTVEDGVLWNNTPEESPFPLDPSGGEISLESFIRTRAATLTEKTKRIIAVMLGHGILHLLGTGWIQRSWSASNIIFYMMSSAIPIRPYVQVNLVDDATEQISGKFDDTDDDDEDYFGNDDCFTHPFPDLVMLGMMLMQVYMARTLESFAEEFDMEDPERLDSNGKFALASLTFKKYTSAISFSEQYWFAIDKCLDPNIQYNEDGGIMDQDGLRRVIYDDIVGPLEDELRQGNFSTGSSHFIRNLDNEARNLDLANWGQPLKFETAHESTRTSISLPKLAMDNTLDRRSQDQPAIQLSTGRSRGSYARAGRRERAVGFPTKQMWWSTSVGSGFFDDETSQEDVKQQARDEYFSWKEDVLEVYDKFLTVSTTRQPTKIAVLDTGLDFEHPDFVHNAERSQRVKSHKDFTKKEPSGGEKSRQTFDESGHGTHIAGLLLDFAPDSELYVAKIAERDSATSEVIAKAVRHAVDDWKVDIITMSFGFTTRKCLNYNLIEQALEYANSKNVLLFAAASNSGSNQKRTFPARHDYVICVHSTAADGFPSRFNTPSGESNNFATIGEAVESSWPRHLCDKEMNVDCIAWKSGTSFATPIAVGIATFLLQYAKQYLDGNAIKLLRRPQGMRAVFKEISRQKDGYDYVAPKVHPDHLFGSDKEYVRHRISSILQGA